VKKVTKRQTEYSYREAGVADDFMIAHFRYKDDAEKFCRALGTRMEKLDLALMPEKTNASNPVFESVLSFQRISGD
jgi:hypothetical protein